MQAIVTRYAGPTDTRGSRVIASCQAKRITVPWDHALNADQNHTAAARELSKRLGWSGRMASGALPDGRGYAHVFVTDGATFDVGGE